MSMFLQQQALCVDESSLTHLSVLGSGGFGYVSLKMDSHLRFYAKKSSPLNYVATLEKELRIMLNFTNHPRIVQASSSNLYIDTHSQRCYIYMEYAPKGTLYSMINGFCGRPMPEYVIGRVVHMILEGLEAFHSKGYVHCDIKPSNILVFPSKAVGEPWDLKLADFDLSKEPFTNSRSLLGGTKQYMPPECYGPNVVITPAVDIWSLGCVVLQMFGGCSDNIGNVYMWRLPKLDSPMADDFLKRCLVLQPSHRATAEELLKHPFVAQRLPRSAKLMSPSFLRFPCAMRNSEIQGGDLHNGFNTLKI